MTTPTQAQIEAATNAIEDTETGHFDRSEWRKLAEAALAAAAEVGHWPLDNPTSEQVEERWERCFKDAADNIRRKERAATIERCAQVAETMISGARTEFEALQAAAIAAAIRALTAAAEVGTIDTLAWPPSALNAITELKDELEVQRASQISAVNQMLEAERRESATIERCAQYHDNAAIECDKIAAVNMDNNLGPDCITRAQDHRIDAAAIRALKDKP